MQYATKLNQGMVTVTTDEHFWLVEGKSSKRTNHVSRVSRCVRKRILLHSICHEVTVSSAGKERKFKSGGSLARLPCVFALQVTINYFRHYGRFSVLFVAFFFPLFFLSDVSVQIRA